ITVILVIVFLALPYAISTLYTGGIGGRRAFKETPANYGIAFEEVEFKTTDGLTLKGWYLPQDGANAKGTVVYCHGLFNERSELLDQAVYMHRNGFRGLLFDFRRHGKSDGDLITFGYFERQDVEAALGYVTSTKGETGPIILWGISMGAANALLAGAEQSSVGAIIAESSFYSARETLGQDLKRMFRLPTFPFAGLIERITEWRTGIDLDVLDLGKAAGRLENRPVLLVGGTADIRMPIENNTRIYNAIPGNAKEQYIVQDAGHADAWRIATDTYKTRVTTFLQNYGLLGPPNSAPE
ncbi:MAG: alpha/beta hydrolase, partial [candidate division Zixibacteria bacterium]|nr:alpha/beta hydrolase [candidate division Zixibacteria bacterium]